MSILPKGDKRSLKDMHNFHLQRRSAVGEGDSSAEVSDDPMPDYMALLSLVFGVAALLMKYPFFSLQSLLCFFISIANMKSADIELKQVFSSVSVSLMAIFMSYRGDIAALRATW
mmetsp:Transcript_10971/g.16450  ORF Transcript_10971/g.16450 Transcript_10971/m.16450 type:complete len:115 (+) Transcript_10971:50-394(+)